ncbi:MAG: hypothetical protein KKD65_12765 [Gammaproteobacteria bacterium]|nr:hypothetical protein [Gammaproteobacteria bacterium]
MSDINNILTLIAKNHFAIETLEVRNRDQLDFHEVGVTQLKDALYAAFMIGCEVGIQNPQAIGTEIDDEF